MKKLYYILIVVLLASFTPKKTVKSKFTAEGKKVTVFTTADKTDLRISNSGYLSFTTIGQPRETDVCVFVDPNKSFQTLVGIGGALTDASAEVFAKHVNDMTGGKFDHAAVAYEREDRLSDRLYVSCPGTCRDIRAQLWRSSIVDKRRR